MARGRMISTTIALDPEFNAMTEEAQLCFLRTVPHLDRDGLIIGQPAALWATIAPLMPSLLPRIPTVIAEWQRAGLVQVFDTKIGPVLYFDGFHRNQVGIRYDREPASRYPLPDDCERTPDGIRQVSGNVPLEEEVEREVEREVEAEEERPAAAAKSSSVVSPAWQAYTENMPGVVTPVIADQVNALIDDYGDRDVYRAIVIACERNKRSLGYVKGVLERGIDTPKPAANGRPSKNLNAMVATAELVQEYRSAK